MRTYISGKITGLPEADARQKFIVSETLLRCQGYDPINPFNLIPDINQPTWADYMAHDIRNLMECQAIYMQRDWGQSKGARIEYQIALELGLIVMFEGAFN